MISRKIRVFFPFSVLAEVVGTIMLEITEALTEIQITEIPIMEIQTMATESKSPKFRAFSVISDFT